VEVSAGLDWMDPCTRTYRLPHPPLCVWPLAAQVAKRLRDGAHNIVDRQGRFDMRIPEVRPRERCDPHLPPILRFSPCLSRCHGTGQFVVEQLGLERLLAPLLKLLDEVRPPLPRPPPPPRPRPPAG